MWWEKDVVVGRQPRAAVAARCEAVRATRHVRAAHLGAPAPPPRDPSAPSHTRASLDCRLLHFFSSSSCCLQQLLTYCRPCSQVLYLFSFLDRSAIGNAKTAGMNKSLKLTDSEYAGALSAFFALYCLLEVPSNILLKKYGAKIYLPCIVVLVRFPPPSPFFPLSHLLLASVGHHHDVHSVCEEL